MQWEESTAEIQNTWGLNSSPDLDTDLGQDLDTIV